MDSRHAVVIPANGTPAECIANKVFKFTVRAIYASRRQAAASIPAGATNQITMPVDDIRAAEKSGTPVYWMLGARQALEGEAK